jgi:ABC-2 type transport system ATP-binding protein
VGDPELLFLDEPTTGLDPQSRRQLWDVINTFRATNRSVMLTTHYMDEAERLCDRVAIVDHGQIIAQGTPRELIARLGGEHVVTFALAANGKPPLDPTELEALASVKRAWLEQESFSLSVSELHLALPAVLSFLKQAGRDLATLSTRHATLEDVFVNLTGRHLRESEEAK